MARPKLKSERERKHPVSITLTKKQINTLKKLGRGNISDAVRTLVDNVIDESYKSKNKGGINEKTNEY